MNKLKFSHSAMTTYEQCPKMYYLKYIEGIKPLAINSPLFFGSAIDEALSAMLMQKKFNPSQEELDVVYKSSPEQEFIKRFTHDQDGVFLPTNEHCSYFQSDFDRELLTEEDWKELMEFDKDITSFDAFFEGCREDFKAKRVLNLEDQKTFNFMCWLSLKRKGLLMIQAYREQIYPEIYEVFDIQKDILLPNDNGDLIRGKIDFIASFNDQPATKYICDNKTSSKPYSEDSVSISDQLAIYCEAEGYYTAAYCVVEKKLRVKEPRVRANIIKDTIKEENVQKTFDKADSIMHNIADGCFDGLDNNKKCNFFGKRCNFYSYCWGNKDMTGLIKKEIK